MEDKVKKVEEIPPHIQKFRKKYQRYQRNYRIIVCFWIAATIAIGYFTNLFWCTTAFCFGFWSLIWYDEGAQENCMEEWEYAYPQDGFRLMFKSWPWFAVISIIAYFFCKRFMPYFFD